jgi:hypothetical protein
MGRQLLRSSVKATYHVVWFLEKQVGTQEILLVPQQTELGPRLVTDHVQVLPGGIEVLSVTPSGASAWVQTVRIEVRLPDDSTKYYFKKVCIPIESLANML